MKDDWVPLGGSASDMGKGKQVGKAGSDVMSGGKKGSRGGRIK